VGTTIDLRCFFAGPGVSPPCNNNVLEKIAVSISTVVGLNASLPIDVAISLPPVSIQAGRRFKYGQLAGNSDLLLQSDWSGLYISCDDRGHAEFDFKSSNELTNLRLVTSTLNDLSNFSNVHLYITFSETPDSNLLDYMLSALHFEFDLSGNKTNSTASSDGAGPSLISNTAVNITSDNLLVHAAIEVLVDPFAAPFNFRTPDIKLTL
jgi:hypothetical protein